jgi:hypothetical protein
MLLVGSAAPFLNTKTSSCPDRYRPPIPAFVFDQIQRVFEFAVWFCRRVQELAHVAPIHAHEMY